MKAFCANVIFVPVEKGRNTRKREKAFLVRPTRPPAHLYTWTQVQRNGEKSIVRNGVDRGRSIFLPLSSVCVFLGKCVANDGSTEDRTEPPKKPGARKLIPRPPERPSVKTNFLRTHSHLPAKKTKRVENTTDRSTHIGCGNLVSDSSSFPPSLH